MRISDWSSDVCSSDLHLRENRALHLARAIGNRPRLALDDPEFALFGDERGECRLRLGAGVGGDAEYAIAAIDPQRPAVTLGEMRLPPGQHRPKRTIERVRRHAATRSEEHTSELQSLMRISYAVFCLKKKQHTN